MSKEEGWVKNAKTNCQPKELRPQESRDCVRRHLRAQALAVSRPGRVACRVRSCGCWIERCADLSGQLRPGAALLMCFTSRGWRLGCVRTASRPRPGCPSWPIRFQKYLAHVSAATLPISLLEQPINSRCVMRPRMAEGVVGDGAVLWKLEERVPWKPEHC